MHPQFASKVVMSPEFDSIIASLTREQSGAVSSHIVARLRQLEAKGKLSMPLEVVLRELLSLSLAHSKSSIPGVWLDRPEVLRRVMIETMSFDLGYLEKLQKLRKAEGKFKQDGASRATLAARSEARRELKAYAKENGDAVRSPKSDHYEDLGRNAYSWLVSKDPEVQELVQDVTESLRVLRAGDALRIRGADFKASGGHPIFLDHRAGRAVIQFEDTENGRRFLIRKDGGPSLSEANVLETVVDPAQGDLRIKLFRGVIGGPGNEPRVADAMAELILDIEQDYFASFARSGPIQGYKRGQDLNLILEVPSDNAAIGELIRQRLESSPGLKGRVRLVPSKPMSRREKGLARRAARRDEIRFRNGENAKNLSRRHGREILGRIEAAGLRLPEGSDPDRLLQGGSVDRAQARRGAFFEERSVRACLLRVRRRACFVSGRDL